MSKNLRSEEEKLSQGLGAGERRGNYYFVKTRPINCYFLQWGSMQTWKKFIPRGTLIVLKLVHENPKRKVDV